MKYKEAYNLYKRAFDEVSTSAPMSAEDWGYVSRNMPNPAAGDPPAVVSRHPELDSQMATERSIAPLKPYAGALDELRHQMTPGAITGDIDSAYENTGRYRILDPLSYEEGAEHVYPSYREAIKARIADWKTEGDKGRISSQTIPDKDWNNRGLLEFLHYGTQTKTAADVANLGWNDPALSSPAARQVQVNQFLNNSTNGTWIPGIATGLTFAGAYALQRALRKKRINALGLLGWGIGGTLAGKGGAWIYNILKGIPYNRTYDVSKIKPGQKIYIGVSGAGDGPGSELDMAMRNKLGEGNYAMFRWSDRDKLQQFMDSLPEGVDPIIWAHSWGGSQIQRQLPWFKNKNITVNTVDPVGWRGKLTGQHVKGTVYTPNDYSVKSDPSNLSSLIGGRWTEPKADRRITYSGGHSKGVQQLVESQLSK